MSGEYSLEQYHLAVVVEYDNAGEIDPKAKAIGIVTLEDVIEEMIQEEIIDETDVFSKFDSLKIQTIPTVKMISL